jgi:hypothetical protein
VKEEKEQQGAKEEEEEEVDIIMNHCPAAEAVSVVGSTAATKSAT